MLEALSTLKANWAIISQAKLIFGTWTVILSGLIWTLTNWFKRNQVEDLKARLSLRDDEIADYKRRLHGETAEQAQQHMRALEDRIAQLTADPFVGIRDDRGEVTFDGGDAGGAQGQR